MLGGLPQKVGRRGWDLRRFGFSPDTVRYRLWPSDAPAILCISFPKAGTHLLERALCLHPHLYRRVVPTLHPNNLEKWGGLERLLRNLRAGQILVAHLYYSEESLRILRASGAKSVFIIRDPRDAVISEAFYISSRPKHYLHDVIAAQPDLNHKLRLLIDGDAAADLPGIGRILDVFAGWLHAGVPVVRFEDLVGDQQTRVATLRSIYRDIGVGYEERWIEELSGRLISPVSPTFRSGATEQWPEYFDPELKRRFKAVAGQRLVEYGYESSLDW